MPTKTKATKSVKVTNTTKSAKPGIRDLQKIVDDPETYANSVTVKRLVTILQKCDDQYYATSDPLVDDDTYDSMREVLKERDSKNIYLFQTGAHTVSRDDVALPFGMPSLDKIKPGEKSLPKFFKEYPGPFIITDKLDGISLQIYKDAHGNVDMYTKKQTMLGTSKKHLIKHLIKQKTLDAIPCNTSVRGELLISKKDFTEYENLFAPGSDDRPSNPRNFIGGLQNSSVIDTRVLDKIQLVMYGIISPQLTFSDQIMRLKKWGFKVA
jgi:DNA ligase (NAD+)